MRNAWGYRGGGVIAPGILAAWVASCSGTSVDEGSKSAGNAGGGGHSNVDSGVMAVGVDPLCPALPDPNPPAGAPYVELSQGALCHGGTRCPGGANDTCDCIDGAWACTFTFCPRDAFGGSLCGRPLLGPQLPPGCSCNGTVQQPGNNIICSCYDSTHPTPGDGGQTGAGGFTFGSGGSGGGVEAGGALVFGSGGARDGGVGACAGAVAEAEQKIAEKVVDGGTVQTPVSCDYLIPPPPAGSPFDPDRVNVLIGNGPDPIRAPRVDNSGGCGADGGWFYDDAAKPTEVLLCPTTCSTAAAAVGASVRVEFGCATVRGFGP
jgi:hypothetical protein